MIISKMRIANYKSFRVQNLDFDRFNVLVGANASGKSNLISVFQFLKDTVTYGLDNAISMQGGTAFLRNINIGSSEPLEIEIWIEEHDVPTLFSTGYRRKREFLSRTMAYRYKLSIQFHKRGTGYRVNEEELETDLMVWKRSGKPARLDESDMEVSGKVIIKRDKSRTTTSHIPTKPTKENVKLLRDVVRTMIYPRPKVGLRESMIEVGPFNQISYFFGRFIKGISIYDFDPKLCKKASEITGKTELEPDGCNLAFVLKNLMKNRENTKRFTRLMRSLLPFIEGMKVEGRVDKSLLTSIEEKYSKKKLLPAPFISDGTMNLTALVLALYFEEKQFVIIEEPEGNIHPHLISKVVDMMRDVSSTKQIIATTHNPELVRHTGLEGLILISRDSQGYSKVTRPSKNEQVQTFLAKDMGLDDLYIENLLEW